MAKLNPALTGQGRVFINVDGEGCGKTYTYYNCMKVDGLDKSLGDITSIYCPDPNQYDTFIEVASIKGTDSRYTSTLSGKWPIDSQSPLEELLNQGCPFSLQVHYGRCTRPDSFTEFESALIITDARLTNYSLSTLTAISPDERAAIDETAAFSAANAYRIFTPSFANVAATEIAASGVVTGITNADSKSCGGICATRSDGCQVWIARTGENSTANNFLYTTDGGVTWTTVSANLPTTLTRTNPEQGQVIAVGSKLYTASFDTTIGYIYSMSLSSIVTDNAPTPTEIYSLAGSTFFQFAKSDSYVWVAGTVNNIVSGAVLSIDRTTDEVTTFDLPGLTFLAYAVDAYDDDYVLVGGVTGQYAYSTSYGIFTSTTIPGVAATITSVKMIDRTNWLAYGDGAGIYCTSDAGKNWKLVKTDAAGARSRFAFYDTIVGYIQLTDGVYRTIDSGNTWTKLYSTTNAYNISAEVCPTNPNILFMASGWPLANSVILKGSS